MQFSIIIPTFDEAAVIASTLRPLQPLRQRGVEVIVVDGGSRDPTIERARPLVDRLLCTEPGRARQMNAGARAASGEVLLFLHADTRLPDDWRQRLSELSMRPFLWGRFDVRLSGRQTPLRLVEAAMNRRSRLTGIATGDQAIFVTRSLFERVGGYPEIALMEDIALSRRLKAVASPVCLTARVTTSSRRWERNGIGRTVVLMWWLRLRFFLGADPQQLARRYYR